MGSHNGWVGRPLGSHNHGILQQKQEKERENQNLNILAQKMATELPPKKKSFFLGSFGQTVGHPTELKGERREIPIRPQMWGDEFQFQRRSPLRSKQSILGAKSLKSWKRAKRSILTPEIWGGDPKRRRKHHKWGQSQSWEQLWASHSGVR